MPTKSDSRQIVQRNLLSELTKSDSYTSSTGKPANTTEGDNLFSSIDNCLAPLYRIYPVDPTPTRSFTVSTHSKANLENAKNTLVPPIAGTHPTLASSATISLPSTSNNNITNSLGDNVLLPTMTSGYYRKLLISAKGAAIVLTVGAESSTAAAAVTPNGPHNATDLGLVMIHDVAGSIQVVTFADIYQYDERDDHALQELNTYFSGMQMTVKSANKKRIQISGIDFSKLDLTVLGNAIDASMLSFTGAEIDFSTGVIYAADGSTPLGTNFTCVTPTVSSDWICYSINLAANVTNADGSVSPAGLVLTPTATSSTKSATQKPQMNSGGINLGWVFVQDSGTGVAGAINDITQADIKQLSMGGGSGSSAGGAGTNSVKEYILNPSGKVNLTGWNTYADAAGTIPVDGTSGSPTAGMWTRNTIDPITTTADFLLTHSAANEQGMGVSYDFVIEKNDYLGSQYLAVDFSAMLKSGTYTQGDIKVFLYDITNSVLLNNNVAVCSMGDTTDIKNTISSTAIVKMRASCLIPTNCLSARLIFHQTTTNATAYSIQIAAISVNNDPFKMMSLSNDTDWVNAGAMTIGGTTSAPTIGTTSINEVWWRRDGPDMILSYRLICSAGSANNGNGNYLVHIPSGYLIDTAKTGTYTTISSSASSLINTNNIVGTGNIGNIENNNDFMGIASVYSSTQFRILGLNAGVNSTHWAHDTGYQLGYKIAFVANVRVPILGWTATSEHVVTPAKNSARNATSYTPTLTGFGTITASDFKWSQEGESLVGRGYWVNGTVAASLASIPLPSGLTIDTVKMSRGNTTSNPGQIIGNFSNNASGNNGFIVTATGTDATRVYFGGQNSSAVTQTPVNGSDISTNSTAMSVYFKVPITNWSMESQFLGAIPPTRIAYLKDVKAAGSGGGTATSGSWLTRVLNTLEGDTSIVSLASNQFTLQAGTYDIYANGTFLNTNGSAIGIYNVSDSSLAILGGVSYGGGYEQCVSILVGRLVLASTKILELRYKVQGTVATYGLGNNGNNGESNIFAQVEITKLT
jgi:hypothetical protein